jgi:hypothetical protein
MATVFLNKYDCEIEILFNDMKLLKHQITFNSGNVGLFWLGFTYHMATFQFY